MKLLHFLFVIGIVGFSISCNKSESPKNAEAKLLTVTGSFGVGLIDTSAKTVIIKALENMDVTQIIPQFEL